MNLIDHLVRRAELSPDAIAIRRPNDPLTFAELATDVSVKASLLSDAGVKPGDIVAIRLASHYQHWLATLSLVHAGATIASLPNNMDPEQEERLLASFRPRFLVSEDGMRRPTSVAGASLEPLSWQAVRTAAPARTLPPASVPDDQPWQFACGSGSTGRAKILPFTHAQYHRRVEWARQSLPLGPEDTIFSMVGMPFVAAKGRAFDAIGTGAAIYLDDSDSRDLRPLVATGEITVMLAMVGQIEALLRAIGPVETPLYGKLRSLMLTGSTVSMRLRNLIRERLTENLHVMWGTNECGIVSLTGTPEVYSLPRGVGRPAPGFTVEIVDGQDEPVPAGEIGRVRVSSPTTISGYLDDPEATARAFRGEWFYPGDLAEFTSDGQLVHHGRADDMMIVNGINVYPAEVEECLRGWPDVRDTVVLPVPHPIVQQSPIAVVSLDEGSQLSPADLLLEVQKKLGAHCLHDLVVIPQIPRSEHGKLARERLQPLLRAIWGATVQPAPSRGRYGDPFSRSECLVTFTPPEETRSLGPWLELLGSAPLQPAEERPTASAGEQWLREALLLHAALLQTLSAPVFEPVASGSCTRLGTAVARWQARCILPCPTLAPPGVARDLLAKAFVLADWASAASPAELRCRSQFFAEVNRLVVEPYRQLIPAGRSTFGILKEASRRNLPWLALPGGVYQLGWGSRACRIDRSTTNGDSAIARDLAQDKQLTAALLRAGGLPPPVHEAVSTVEEAKAAAERIGFPVVLKPIDQDRGEGVIVDVGPSHLEGATQHLLQTCASGRLLVERQVPGVCHRLFVAKGQVLYAVKRLPAGLIGDGKSSIEQLAARAGAFRAQLPPWRRSPFPRLDAAALQSLKRQGLTPTSVPEQASSSRFGGSKAPSMEAWMSMSPLSFTPRTGGSQSRPQRCLASKLPGSTSSAATSQCRGTSTERSSTR